GLRPVTRSSLPADAQATPRHQIRVFWTAHALPADTRGMSSTHPPFRASDGERDRAIDELRDRAVEGRLSHDTFVVRVDQALRARSQQELEELVADLPRRPTFRERVTGSVTGVVSAISGFTTSLQ